MTPTISSNYTNWLDRIFKLKIEFLFIIFLAFSGQVTAQDVNSHSSQLEQILLLKNDSVKVDSLIAFERKMVNLDELELAIKSGTAAIQIAESIGHKPSIYSAQNSLGYAYKNHGDYTNAFKYYKNALNTAKELNSKAKIARTYASLGGTSRDYGEYLDAVSYFMKAIQLFEEEKDTAGLALANLNLGITSRIQYKYEESLSYYILAEKYYKQINNKTAITNVWHNKGIVFKDLGMYDSAYSYLSNVYEIRKAKKNNDFYSTALSLANSLTLMGEESLKNKDSSKAEIHFFEAEKLYFECINRDIENKNELKQAINYLNLGYLLFKRNRYQDAMKYLHLAKDIREQRKLKSGLPEVYKVLSLVDSTMACDTKLNLEERLHHAQQSQHFKTLESETLFELMNENNNKEIANLKIKYESEAKDNKITLLNKENELQDIILKEQRSALLISKLRNEKNQKEIELLNTTSAITELRLSGTQQELEKQLLKSKSEAYQLQLSKKERDLKNNELSKEKLLRGATTTGSLALLLIGLLFFNRLKLRKQLEQKEAILRQRKSISADLHDDVGSTLSSISIYSEAIKNKLMHNETDKVMDLVNKIGENARETISNLSDIVWSINPINDSGEVIFNRMETFAFSLFSSKGIKLNFTSDKSLHAIHYSIEMKQNMFLIFKEAINNCAKYSQATLVQVDIRKNGKMMNLTISDDGVGFDTKSSSTGNGLRNMQERARELNGTIDIQSMEKGTKISLSLPLAA